jgi:steroid delta-isomerase-like uncharacterized protein
MVDLPRPAQTLRRRFGKEVQVMATEQTNELVRKFYEDVLMKGDLAVLATIATEDYEEHDPVPGQATGLAGLVDRVTILRTALAPKFTVEDVVAAGDRIVVRWTSLGHHVGEFAGLPPTGKTYTIGGIDMYRVRDGKLAEHWHVIDQLSMLQQLGFLPAPQNA